MVQSGRDHILRSKREQRDVGKAGKTKPKLQMNIPLFFIVKLSEFGTSQFKNESDATLPHAVKTET